MHVSTTLMGLQELYYGRNTSGAVKAIPKYNYTKCSTSLILITSLPKHNRLKYYDFIVKLRLNTCFKTDAQLLFLYYDRDICHGKLNLNCEN